MNDEINFRTKLWQRSQNSYASTVPKPLLMMRGVGVNDEIEVVWTVNEDGGIVVEFEQEAKEAGDGGDE